MKGVRLGTTPGVPAIGATTGVSVAGRPPPAATVAFAVFVVCAGVWAAEVVVGVREGAVVGEACPAIFVNSTIAVAAAAVLTAPISTVGAAVAA